MRDGRRYRWRDAAEARDVTRDEICGVTLEEAGGVTETKLVSMDEAGDVKRGETGGVMVDYAGDVTI